MMAMWGGLSRFVQDEANRWMVQSVSQCVSLIRVTVGFLQWQCLFLLMSSLMVSSRASTSIHPQIEQRSIHPETHSALMVLPKHKPAGIWTTQSANRVHLSVWSGYTQLPKWKKMSKVMYGPFQLVNSLPSRKLYNHRLRKSKRDLWSAAPLHNVQSLLGLEPTKKPHTPKDWNSAVKDMIEQIFGGRDTIPVKSGVLKSRSSSTLPEKTHKLQLGSLRNWTVFRRLPVVDNDAPMALSLAEASFSTPTVKQTASFKSSLITKAVNQFIQPTSVQELYNITGNKEHTIPEMSMNQGMVELPVTTQPSPTGNYLENMTNMTPVNISMPGVQELMQNSDRIPPFPIMYTSEHKTSIVQNKIPGMQELVINISGTTNSNVTQSPSLLTHTFSYNEHSTISFDIHDVAFSTEERKGNSSLTSSPYVLKEQTINHPRNSELSLMHNAWEQLDIGGTDVPAYEIQSLAPLNASMSLTELYSQEAETNTLQLSATLSNHKLYTLPTVAGLDGTPMLSTYSKGPTTHSVLTKSEQISTHSDNLYGTQVTDTYNPAQHDDWNPAPSHVTTKSIKSFTSFGVGYFSIKTLNKTNGSNRSATERSTVIIQNITSLPLNHSIRSLFPIYSKGSQFVSTVDPPTGYNLLNDVKPRSSSASTSQTSFTQSFTRTPDTKHDLPTEKISAENKTEAFSSSNPSTSLPLNHNINSPFPIYSKGFQFTSSIDPPTGYNLPNDVIWKPQSSSTSTSQTSLAQTFQMTPNTKHYLLLEKMSVPHKTEVVSSSIPSFLTKSPQIPLNSHTTQPQGLSSIFPHTLSGQIETGTIVNKDQTRFDGRWFSSQTITSVSKSIPSREMGSSVTNKWELRMSDNSSQPYNTGTDVLFGSLSVDTGLDTTPEQDILFSPPQTTNVSIGFRIPKRHRPSCSHFSVPTTLLTRGTSVHPTTMPVLNASPQTSKSTTSSAFAGSTEITAHAQHSVTKSLPILSSVKLVTSQHSTVSHTESHYTSPVFSPVTPFNITVSGLKPKIYSVGSEPSTIDLKTNTYSTRPSYFASLVSKIGFNSTEPDKIFLAALTSFSHKDNTTSKPAMQTIPNMTEVPLTPTYAEFFSVSQSDDPLVERGEVIQSTTRSSVVTIPLTFSITGISYSDQLQNTSSVEYKKLQREVELMLDKIFSTQYRSHYLQTKVRHFLSGSVIVLTDIEFHAQSPAPTGSNIVRTLLTSNWKEQSNFGWNVNASSVESNGYTLKNLEPECLSLHFLVLHVGFVAVSSNYKENKIFLDTLKQEVSHSVGVLFPVKNFSITRIRDLRGDLEVVGNLCLDTQVHTNVPVLLNTLLPLVNMSVDLSSIVIEGYRMDLQVFPISFRITNMKFRVNLLDLSSSDFKELSKNLSMVVMSVLQVYDPYQVIIREFKSGSVICKGNLMFRLPAPGSGEVLRTMLGSLGTGDKLGSSSYKVERSTLNVADSTPGLHFEYVHFPGFAVAIIVMCGLAILIFPTLAYMCIKTRMLGHRNKATIQRPHDSESRSHHLEMDNRAFRATIEQP